MSRSYFSHSVFGNSVRVKRDWRVRAETEIGDCGERDSDWMDKQTWDCVLSKRAVNE